MKISLPSFQVETPGVSFTKHITRLAIFTGRNDVVDKVIFLHLFVILFTGGGGTVNERPVRILLECILVCY